MCKLSPVYKQFLVVISCNILTFAVGFSSGWATINLPELLIKNDAYSFTLTKEEASLLVSFLFLGSLLGNYLIIPIAQLLGTKRTIHSIGIPMIACPLLIIWAKNVYCLYVSRILIGVIYGGLIVIVPALVSELCSDKIRGALNSICELMKNFGLICSFVLGSHLNSMDQAKIQLIPIIIFMGVMFALPDTPDYWISRNDKQRALKSCRFYKGRSASLNMRNEPDFHPIPQNEHDVKSGNESQNAFNNNNNKDHVSNSKLTFRDFCTPHAKRSYIILTCTQTLCKLCGTLLIVGFITNIFNETGSILSGKDSSTLIVVIQFISNVVFLLIVEKINRKTLYVWSSILTTASYALFTGYGFFWSKQSGFEWIPTVCIAAVIFFSSTGFMPLSYIMTPELLPRKICKPSFSLFASLFWVQMFLSGSIFLTILNLIGIYYCVIIFSFACILNALFAIFYLPETRGKSFEEIEEIMSK